MSEGQVTLTLLHDLALLYLGLAHGTDEDLDPSETHEIAAKLRRWQPDKDPALIDHVLREATLTYLNCTDEEPIREAVETLKKVLTKDLRQKILHDLHDIARADGSVALEETHFIHAVAAAWEIDLNTVSNG